MAELRQRAYITGYDFEEEGIIDVNCRALMELQEGESAVYVGKEQLIRNPDELISMANNLRRGLDIGKTNSEFIYCIPLPDNGEDNRRELIIHRTRKGE